MNNIAKPYLICIYSSHEDLPLAVQLRSKIKNSKIAKSQKNIIVLANPDQKKEFHYNEENKTLYLKVKECYTYLSLKTELMIKACNELFDFDFLVKWDASTLTKERCYGDSDSADNCLDKLLKFEFKNWHYYSHLHASTNGLDSKKWFMQTKGRFLETLIKEGRDLECMDFIPKQIFYFRGKFYIMSKEFCKFVSKSRECSEIFLKNFQHNFGNEDMSVGMCFQQFEKNHDK